MKESKKYFAKPKGVQTIQKFGFLFFWVQWFYPKAKKFEYAYLLVFFIPQKIWRKNGRVPWPVHPTSRVLHHKNIQIGNRTAPGLNSGCYIQGRGGIVIGHNCRFGPNVGLISANHDPSNYDQWVNLEKPITIGNNVWIAMNSVVMPGISIGDNVIIGANSTVTQDIPSDSIAVGSPARVIKNKSLYEGKRYG